LRFRDVSKRNIVDALAILIRFLDQSRALFWEKFFLGKMSSQSISLVLSFARSQSE
jgi:hypothetical protein